MLAGFFPAKGIFDGNDPKNLQRVLITPLPAALFVPIAQASREMLYKDLKLTIVSTIRDYGRAFTSVYFIYKYCF